ncbi:MAG: hypothetical protein AVDCRST_MAG67-3385, partial [uncultured Solirubrobacteraceae bacterium]
ELRRAGPECAARHRFARARHPRNHPVPDLRADRLGDRSQRGSRDRCLRRKARRPRPGDGRQDHRDHRDRAADPVRTGVRRLLRAARGLRVGGNRDVPGDRPAV